MPNPILVAVGGVSTLTFASSNPNAGTALNGVAFADTFPAGLQVAATPNATTTGCGSPTFPPAAGNASLSFAGGTIAASGSRVATVAVTATIVGSKVNTTGSVTSTNGGAGNSGSATLTAVDANIQLTPASAGNPAGTNHVLTITVNALGGTIDAGSHTATASIVSGPGSSRRPPPTGSVSRTRS